MVCLKALSRELQGFMNHCKDGNTCCQQTIRSRLFHIKPEDRCIRNGPTLHCFTSGSESKQLWGSHKTTHPGWMKCFHYDCLCVLLMKFTSIFTIRAIDLISIRHFAVSCSTPTWHRPNFHIAKICHVNNHCFQLVSFHYEDSCKWVCSTNLCLHWTLSERLESTKAEELPRDHKQGCLQGDSMF